MRSPWQNFGEPHPANARRGGPFLAALWLLAAGGVALAVAGGAGEEEPVRAQQFVLVDATGKEFGFLGLPEAGAKEDTCGLFSRSGGFSLSATLRPDGGPGVVGLHLFREQPLGAIGAEVIPGRVSVLLEPTGNTIGLSVWDLPSGAGTLLAGIHFPALGGARVALQGSVPEGLRRNARERPRSSPLQLDLWGLQMSTGEQAHRARLGLRESEGSLGLSGRTSHWQVGAHDERRPQR